MTQRQAASRRLKECAPGMAPQPNLGRVPKQGPLPVIGKWTPRPEVPRLEMKSNATEQINHQGEQQPPSAKKFNPNCGESW